jgi:hypothetical protein
MSTGRRLHIAASSVTLLLSAADILGEPFVREGRNNAAFQELAEFRP